MTLPQIKKVYDKIKADKPGYAIANLDGQDVAFDKGDDPIGVYHGTTGLKGQDFNDAIILSIAKGRELDISGEAGLATKKTFSMNDLKRMKRERDHSAATTKDKENLAALRAYEEAHPDVFI